MGIKGSLFFFFFFLFFLFILVRERGGGYCMIRHNFWLLTFGQSLSYLAK